MRGLVVYYSRYGNCERVARSIHNGLEDAGVDVTIVEVTSADVPGENPDFMILGSPTRGGKAAKPVGEFMDSLGADRAGKMRFAAFGTGYGKWIDKGKWPMAADDIQAVLKGRGFEPLAEPFKGRIKGGPPTVKGPLLEGEVEKAYEYGRSIASSI